MVLSDGLLDCGQAWRCAARGLRRVWVISGAWAPRGLVPAGLVILAGCPARAVTADSQAAVVMMAAGAHY